MKKLILPLLAAVLTTAACKKDKNNTPSPGNGSGTDSSIVVSDVDKMKLTITKVNTPVAPHQPGPYSVYMEMHRGTIYVGNPSNTAKPQYFDMYDIGSNSFTVLDTTKNLCACGYGSRIVSDGNDRIYYIANDATYYSASAKKWTWFNLDASVKDNFGEAGAMYMDNKIYYIGGRTANTRVKYFDLKTNSWYNSADFPYSTNSCDGVAVNGKLYVLGGVNGKKKFSVYDPAANKWTTKPELSFETNFDDDRHFVASIGQYLFVLQDYEQKIQIYDTKADKWSATPVTTAFAMDSRYTNLFSWNNKLYVAGQIFAGDFQLYQVSVSE